MSGGNKQRCGGKGKGWVGEPVLTAWKGQEEGMKGGGRWGLGGCQVGGTRWG